MHVEIHTEGPPLSCRNMYLWYIWPPFKQSLIDDVVGFSTFPAAGDGTLTHHLYVSLVSSQMETVSKTCHFLNYSYNSIALLYLILTEKYP